MFNPLAYSNIWLTHTNHLSSLPATPVTNNERFLIYSFLCDLLYFCFVCNSISLMSTGSVSTCMAPRVFMNYALSSDPYNRKRMTLALCIYELIYCIITFMSVSINCCFSAHAPPTLPWQVFFLTDFNYFLVLYNTNWQVFPWQLRSLVQNLVMPTHGQGNKNYNSLKFY